MINIPASMDIVALWYFFNKIIDNLLPNKTPSKSPIKQNIRGIRFKKDILAK